MSCFFEFLMRRWIRMTVSNAALSTLVSQWPPTERQEKKIKQVTVRETLHKLYNKLQLICMLIWRREDPQMVPGGLKGPCFP